MLTKQPTYSSRPFTRLNSKQLAQRTMICQRCLHRASALAHLPKTSIPASTSQLRPLTNHPTSQRPPFSRTLTTTTPTPASSPPSTSTAVEFASPLTPILPPSTRTATSKAPTTPTSSVPAGNALRGLNYLKSGSEPVALEDDAYPAWLWRCLDDAGKKRGGGDGGDGGGGGQDGLDADLFCSFSPPRLSFYSPLSVFLSFSL